MYLPRCCSVKEEPSIEGAAHMVPVLGDDCISVLTGEIGRGRMPPIAKYAEFHSQRVRFPYISGEVRLRKARVMSLGGRSGSREVGTPAPASQLLLYIHTN